jgi:hypothetical protein
MLAVLKIPLLPLSWGFAALCLLAGCLLGFRALLLILVVEGVWWLAIGTDSGFENQSGNGDSLGAEGVFAAIVGAVVGSLAALVGIGLRTVVRNRRSRADHSG